MADRGRPAEILKSAPVNCSKRIITNAIAVLLFFGAKGEAEEELSPFLNHYEVLSYMTDPLQRNIGVHRQKRSAEYSDDATHVRFKALGRDFHLVLRRDMSAFADNFVVKTPQGPVDVDISHIYSGHVEGDPDSRVHGSVVDGVFEGRIATGDGHVFYAEPSWKYAGRLTKPGHTIFYAAEDVRLPPELVTHGGCGFDKLQTHLAAQGIDLRSRSIVTDHLLYESYVTGTDDKTARERITALVGGHITGLNLMYTNVDFDGVVGMSFVLQDLRINDTTACSGSGSARNQFCRGDLDANLMLQIFALEERNDFCLSHVWTNRDLGEGTLGLAYLGYPNEKLGGVCEKFRVVNTREGIRNMALNTGVVTFLLHGAPVARAVSEVTVAHEIGHSFGAMHDETSQCAPGGATGNYIMFARATTGLEPFNRLFSPCSIKYIGAVLNAVLQDKFEKENCFLLSQASFCGNNVREEKEECDCGYKELDCRDQCCYPRKNSRNAPGCTLRPNMQCSPSAGSCCTDDCHFHKKEHRCATETECAHESYCECGAHSVDSDLKGLRCTTWIWQGDGTCELSGDLPVTCGCCVRQANPLPKPNMTECNSGTQVCKAGRCEGSVCEKFGYEDCQRVSTGPISPSDMCLLDCKPKGSTGSCLDTCITDGLGALCGRIRERGAACNQNRGYCDVFRRCRTVDEGGALSRLEQLFIPNKVREWIKAYKWAVVLVVVLFLFGILLFIRCCAVLTPTNNPRLPKAKSFKDSVRSPMKFLKGGQSPS